MQALLRHVRACIAPLGVLMAFAGPIHAQTVYGVGQAGTGNLTIAGSTRLFSINTTTGAATNICGLSSPSTAVSVSSIDGQAYYIDRDGTGTPKLYRINPLTCANTFVGNITGAASGVLGDVTLRATHCPDGRFYAATNVGQFFEISANNAATLRALNWTNLPTGGSGDFACTDNGDLYSVAPIANNSGTYRLYRANAADFATVASGSNVPVTAIGANLALAGTPNGLTDGPTGAGCAAAPNPCLYASNSSNNLWRINVTTGAATSVGATNNGLTDLARSFPVDLSFSKTVTPTTALQGQTVFYTLTASNPGPGVVSNILIQDAFPAGVATASWACAVQNAGSATLVTTSCGATPTGSGNINTTVSLSLNATLRFNVTATLSNTFSGTLTNVGQATITLPVTDPNPADNIGTATTTVTPAANLTVVKTNGVGTVTAGTTTSYTVTVANAGPGSATNARVTDPVAPGLNCTSVTCSVGGGAATCPVSPALSIGNLQTTTGVVVPNFPANSSLSFVVTCGVTATGVP
jgi:uncharacterized repeat protein (TIGR01451 family)